MANSSPRNWFSISMLLLGIVLGGFAGVLRGDWVGEDAAREVEARVTRDLVELKDDLKEDIQEIKRDVKELLRLRD